MAYPSITEHWQDIRRLAEQGVPVATLANKYGLKEKSIYNKIASEDWQTPGRLKVKLEQLSREKQNRCSNDPLFKGSSPSEFSGSVLLETWETRAADLRNLSYSVAVEAIQAAKGQIVIESASDLKHAVHVARQATGILDADAPQIQLSLFANQDISGPPIMEAQTYEVEALQPVPDDADFWG
jgi:hypothetical protein